MIPIFDSLAHPTLTGRWLDSDRDARIETLIDAMAANGFRRACAVGMAGVGGYTHDAFAALCRPFAQLVPIAGFDPLRCADASAELDEVCALGFRGIKLHPRFSGFSLASAEFRATLVAAQRRNLIVFLCTYYHSALETYPERDPLFDLVAALKSVPQLRVVLVHGGDVELMRYAQFARHTPNLILDVSHTLLKYRGSSLDADIAYLFEHFNRRMCIGVDHPGYTHGDVRARFETLSADLTVDARANVAHRNLERFLATP